MPKNIIFCADGTWNHPDQGENEEKPSNETNVYKLFSHLKGKVADESLEGEQEKSLSEGGVDRQVAKYIHGVGDSKNFFIKCVGGAFGVGTIARIVRGYTFISRNYDPGDDVFIVGFSRGAYTARALAGFISKQGLLAKKCTTDKEQAYRKGTEAWYRYRGSVSANGIIQRLEQYTADFKQCFSDKTLRDSDLVPVNEIKVVGVWDTVGALGIPFLFRDERLDVFQFADRRLSDTVRFGRHALSLDEERVDFTPTLWEQREGIKQLLFPGAHADVGGGYPTSEQESALSDGALRWMVDELKALGVTFSSEPDYDLKKCPCGKAHEPWRHTFYKTGKRQFPAYLIGHCAIEVRATEPTVYPDPKEKAEKYNPSNRPAIICNGIAQKVCASCLKQVGVS